MKQTIKEGIIIVVMIIIMIATGISPIVLSVIHANPWLMFLYIPVYTLLILEFIFMKFLLHIME